MSAAPPERVQLDGVVLRRERVGDADLIARSVADNLDHLRPWMPWAVPAAATSAAQRSRLVQVEQWWDAAEQFSFLLMDAAESELLGVFGLHRRIGPQALEIGYWLAHGAVGKGHATAAAGALTAAALGLPGITSVEIHCDEANIRSQRVAQRLGYRLDRVEPDDIEAPGEVGRSMIWVFPP